MGSMLRNHAARAVGLTSTSALLLVYKNRAFCSSGNFDTSSMKLFKPPTLPMLYQYKICPFCHRVKAYLDFLKCQYEAIEVNPLTKSELSFSKEYKKVPLAIIDGQSLAGSGAIIDYITENFAGDKKAQLITDDAKKWMEWSEKKLAIMIYPNITRSFADSWECFAYAEDVTSWSALQRLLVRTAGPLAMLFANGRIKSKYGIVDERAELLKELRKWTDAFQGRLFLHGDAPTLPDLMVFGVLRSIVGLGTFRMVMTENSALQAWYERMEQLVGSQEVCAVSNPSTPSKSKQQ